MIMSAITHSLQSKLVSTSSGRCLDEGCPILTTQTMLVLVVGTADHRQWSSGAHKETHTILMNEDHSGVN